jgi:predicted HAD superfamily Cof-like phosphohydrolase
MKTSLVLAVLEKAAELTKAGQSLGALDARELRNAIREVENYETPESMAAEFHTAKGLPVASGPTEGSALQRILRVRLMLEEVLEFAKAACVVVHSESGDEILSARDLHIGCMDLFTPDLVQMTHELTDVQYVVSGTAVELGLPVREALPLIHEANMRKEPVLDSGGKVRKPDGWTPADVSGLLKK